MFIVFLASLVRLYRGQTAVQTDPPVPYGSASRLGHTIEREGSHF